jgi:PleD family two-component response regulator
MAKTKILIVDDDENIRGMHAEVFSKAGFEVTEAIDGLDGLDKAIKNPPNVIFTGIMMPRMDGFGLMEALKKNVLTSTIPVVISSHMGREEDQKKSQELGAKDFIVTGYYTPREIINRVKNLFAENEYKLKIDPSALDANKMAKETGLKEGLRCSKCAGGLVMAAKLIDTKNHVFSARFVCSDCGAQN